MSSAITSRVFGHLPTGEVVEAFTLTGAAGLEVEVITYGGIVTRMVAADRDGRGADVALGFAELAPYLSRHPYFGAITGRVAGRITNAQFTLDGVTYPLVANDAPNHIHGGLQGFDRRLWRAMACFDEDNTPSLRLDYRSVDGEEGYPGNLEMEVVYTVTADNTLLIETNAFTDHPTPFAPTFHGYFHLGGENAGSIADHELQIHAAETIACAENMTFLGTRKSVKGTAADLREARKLGDVIPGLFQQHGDVYLLPRLEPASPLGKPVLQPAARLVHPPSGRVMTVSTSEPCLQFYTGSMLDGTSIGKSGTAYTKHTGLCLECQQYGDGANRPEFGGILRPGEPYHHRTAYTFSTI